MKMNYVKEIEAVYKFVKDALTSWNQDQDLVFYALDKTKNTMYFEFKFKVSVQVILLNEDVKPYPFIVKMDSTNDEILSSKFVIGMIEGLLHGYKMLHSMVNEQVYHTIEKMSVMAQKETRL
jgi:hypothetical protein